MKPACLHQGSGAPATDQCPTQAARLGMWRGRSAAEPAFVPLVGKGRGISQPSARRKETLAGLHPAAVLGEGADTRLGWHKRWLHPCNMFLYYKLLYNKIRPLPN